MTISYKYRYLLNDWQQQAVELLNDKFRQQLRATDDVLMEFADKSENINIQNHFFEAQREIWLKMEDLSLDFHDLLVKFLSKFPAETQKDKHHLGEETLSLINIDLYERNLALHTLAERAERKNYQLMYVLAQRLTVINGGQPVKIASIPASPRQLAEIFARCVDRLSIENDALLVLYTLYDKYVLSELGDLHEKLNQDLINAGILPNLKYKVKIKESSDNEEDSKKSTEHKPSDNDKPQTTEELGEETLSRIQELLMAKRRMQHKQTPLPTGVNAASTQEIVSATNTAISRSEEAYPEAVSLDKAVIPGNVNADVLHQVQDAMETQRSSIKESVGPDRLGEVQENVIDLVGMLFERMLDDPRIPDIAKALLGHLHTPYIKIGLLNDDFLSSKTHPARLFLDEAVEASALWMNQEDPNEGIYPFLKDMVFRIVRLKHHEDADFEEYLNLIKEETTRLSDKFSILEKHSREAEKGKELMSRAKELANNATKKIFSGQTVPEYVEGFINQVWIDYLTLLRLREGVDNNDSPAWNEAQELGQYLLSISAEILDGSVQKPQLDTLSEQIWTQVGGLLPHKGKEIEFFIHSLESKPESQVVLDFSGTVHRLKPKISQNMLDLYNTLRALPENTLFEFNVKEGKSHRARLSWYNPFSDRFLFVNYRGKKTDLVDIKELAEGIRAGNILYFEDVNTSFWSRAMTAIRGMLEKSVKTTG
ncbi:DUF1631 family protein [Thiolapillus brandeum]|uniref:DUF1631 family protein n=1 Tax=Thiolapillus brandeum TaxID=1076588 RepID=A0A7U6GJ20_9GAMM|nr:DUF1631 family protein [Thiolapillus brandeum]BAO44598.1 hypothetical protein TBH_C1681 [Thiolapillus brandeum]